MGGSVLTDGLILCCGLRLRLSMFRIFSIFIRTVAEKIHNCSSRDFKLPFKAVLWIRNGVPGSGFGFAILIWIQEGEMTQKVGKR